MAAEKPTARRDLLLKLQEEAQAKWVATKAFEVDAPANVVSTPDNKFFGNFPYPYMNGMLHLGHAFSLSKLEFAAAYHRMQGKAVLFPFGFHCTGMPIKAAADKLDRECSTYGCPPQFPAPMEAETEPAEPAEAAPAGSQEKFKGKKTKVAAKTGGEVYQWNILKNSAIPEEELVNFRDPVHWLNYFPPLGKRDITSMGCGVDWRRSFITTDANPYYDAFVRWHMNTLFKVGNKIVKDKRFTVYSPLDGQPCADHDRASGEGVGPQDYVLIKMKVMEFSGKLAALEERKGSVFLCAATLRAETMYGQTNYWLLPDGDYGAYEMINGEVFIISARSARNLSFQDMTPDFGKVRCLLELKGTDLMGCPVSSPLSFNEVIYGLPMLTILMTKGTGVVTSVPSDAPDDYMALQDLKKKPAMREKFGIKDEWVMPFEVIPIINIPEFGDASAVTVCEEMKIQSQNDRVKLDEAKNRTYMKGFYEGVMLVGEHKGQSVQVAKPLLKDQLCADGRACLYSEPEKKVMSRSGEECVVALTDQWYLMYGEEEWLAKAKECLSKMQLYSDENLRQFDITMGWLKQWALSRSFGLGTRLPWDPEFLVESLSDSTIYMAYYTIAHILQEGDIFGYGEHTIKPEHVTDAVFDHVFLGQPAPADCAIPADKLAKMKQEFEFWYPFDLRVSGKDLIQNHLTFTIYNHTAIFKPDHWPRSFRCNGHLMLNSEKMSKSTGNFKTLKQAIEEYSSDAMRMALADAGDGLEDANFVEATANASILRLTKELTWIEEMLVDTTLRAGGALTFADRVFEAELTMAVHTTLGHYEALNFREALKYGWFDLQTARDTYRLTCGADNMNRELIMKFIEAQTLLLGPITPHLCEHIWGNLLKKEGCLVRAGMPKMNMTKEHFNLQMAGRYLQTTISDMRKLIAKLETVKKAKGNAPVEVPKKVTGVTLFVKESFTGWHATCLEVLAKHFDSSKREFSANVDKEVLGALAADPEAAASVQGGEKMLKKLAMPFVQFKKAEAINVGAHVLQAKLPFDEKAVLLENAAFIQQALNLQSVSAFLTTDPEAASASEPAKVDGALPGTPGPSFAYA
eukprot:CAMPEP_0114293780 /NCGR_PEP_ID=MMETSP0059-20121206/9775_1 /TAXON_ID=36894 /ORGANISM="Pyramimonas parkeae, Strain CCMP726" /LENGTH=1084 /DNA_ID=CAMNT_0001415513 /DNA_START=16 /DNA_END=3270 /DNA_ORIENTATION=-